MDAVKRTQWLASSMLVATALGLLGLLGRVAYIQAHVTPDIREKLSRQYTAVLPIMPDRGAILFSDGTPGALSVRMYNLFADPGYIIDPEQKLNALKDKQEEAQKAKDMLAEALAPLVNKSADQLLFDIEQNATYADGRPRRFLWLKKEVDENFYNQFAALKAKLREESREENKIASHGKDAEARAAATSRARILYHTLDGVGFVKSIKRVYPLGQLGGSVIGFANNYEGVDGMEHQLDFMLRGIPGQMFVTKDAARHTLLVQDQRYTPADDGRDVWLTVNSVIQGIAQDELQKAVQDFNAESGTAVVMDPFSGRILAMANYPFFDPTDFSHADPDTRRNKAVTDPYEPGSIFKPFIMGWAIENHVVKPTDLIDCHNGHWYDPTGRLVTDVEGYGAISVRDILVHSSNVGMAQLGWRMGIPMMYDAVTRFGFGSRTGVELPGDQRGLVKPLSQWNKGTLTSASFGYEVAATPLQLLRAFCTFANGGYLVTPRIVSAIEESPGKAEPWSDVAGAPLQKQIISNATCLTMRQIMEGVYAEGTAKSAGSKLYDLYGKTGTAHIAGKGRGDDGGHGYGEKDYNSSFLSGGPFRDPRVVVCVTIHRPDKKLGHFAARVAAPAATAIMERTLLYMQIAPDHAETDGAQSRDKKLTSPAAAPHHAAAH
jgi:cell division protein FtsI (penicillin-binding protein 3)